ncbi:MAG: AtpZ/AtpI family protein [Bacteroidota bacterium]|nr:AtpZ/AtpI family protein [Bacteroidota bacterium]
MEKKRKKSSSQGKPPSDFIKYSGIAFQMIAIILAGVYAGIWLDDKFQLDYPIFKLVLSLLSVGLAMYVIIRQVTNDK